MKTVERRGLTTTVLDLPRLTEYGRVYFGYDEFDGVEVESQALNGKLGKSLIGGNELGSHFEARLVRDDIMVTEPLPYQ